MEVIRGNLCIKVKTKKFLYVCVVNRCDPLNGKIIKDKV